MKQKLMSSIGGCLLLAFLLLAFPIRGQAADPITVTDGGVVQYKLSQREDSAGTYSAAISFADGAQPEELHIKSKVTDANGTSYEIRDIKSVAYKDSLRSVEIEEGITSMAGGAWGNGYADSDTVTISFPSTLEDVEDGFLKWEDKQQNSVIVPKWLSKMQSENGVVYAGQVAVYVSDASKVSKITFKDGCTKIAHKALFKNTDVKKVNIPASVKAIGGAAFSGCTNLSQVNFAADAQIEDLDWRAFYDCTALTSIKIPDSVTRIGTETFSGCTSLATVDISKESKLTQIEYGAFGYYPCKKLDVNSIWENKYVNKPQESRYYLAAYRPDEIRDNAGVPVKKIYIPAAVAATGLFAQSETLEEVTFGNAEGISVELPFEMFAQCTNLKTVNFDGNVSNIGVAAFTGCESLQSVNLDGVESLDVYAFAKTGLKEVTIPESVSNVREIAFGGCTALETMTIESSLSKQSVSQLSDILGNIDYGPIVYDEDGKEINYYFHTTNVQQNTPVRSNAAFKKLYPNQTALRVLNIKKDSNGKNVLEERSSFAAHLPGLEEVTLPEGIKKIPSYAFSQCFSLKDVAIPESVQTIGIQAFSFDVSLDIDFTKLTNLTSIEWGAFSIINANGGNSAGGDDDTRYTDEITDNGGIKNIILPESVNTIGSGAFFGQRNVKKIVIPKSVTSIGTSAFQMIPALEELEIYASLNMVDHTSFDNVFWSNTRKNKSTVKGKLKKIILGENYSATGEIGSALFYGLDFDEIDIQMNNIQNLGSSMFMKNTRLKSFTVPKTVKVINQAAFYETTELKEITIPKNVQTMDVEAFRKSGLEKIWILNKDLVIKEPTTENVTEEESAAKTKVYIYNPKEKVKDFIAIPKDVTIYGYAGSTAEAYAKQNGNKFVAINPENKVIFDSVGGSKVEEQTIECGEFAKKPADPAKEGYTFKGWYTNKECTNAFDFDKDSIKEETTLYAKWEKNSSTKPVTPTEPTTAADQTKPAAGETIQKNTKVTRGKYIYKVTSVTKNQTGTVQVCGFAKGKKAATIAIPSTITINGKKFKVTSIAPKAFLKNKTAKKVVIGNNVKVVGTKAFYNAKKLHTITIGKNVTTIKRQAFGKLPKLKKVVVRSKKLKKLKKIKKKIFKPVKHKFTIK